MHQLKENGTGLYLGNREVMDYEDLPEMLREIGLEHGRKLLEVDWEVPTLVLFEAIKHHQREMLNSILSELDEEPSELRDLIKEVLLGNRSLWAVLGVLRKEFRDKRDKEEDAA